MAGGRILIDVDPALDAFPGKLEAGLRGTTGIASTAGKAIGAALGVGLIGAGAGIAAVVKIGNEFDSTLSRIQATSGASAAEMGKVAARARELGTDASLAGTSSSQAAAAIEELAKAGFSVNDSMTVARDAIVLSRAGMLDGGDAASLLANTLNTYGLAAADAGRVTDVFAATANASTTNVRDLGESFKYVAPVAAGLKISLEDTSTALAMLSTAGIKGSEAGTALRGVLASIAAPSGPAKKALDALGVSAFDQAGKFRGLEVITGQLTAAKGRMTDGEFAAATAVAFGNEGMAAANVLATQGVGEFRELGTAVREQGAASKAAAANSQGLSGAMDELQGSAEDVALSIYDLIKGPLADLARGGADGLEDLSALLSGKDIDAGGLERVLEAGRQVLVNLGVAAAPVREGLEELFAGFEEGNGVTSAFSGSVTVLTGGVELLSRVLGPVGDLVGGVLTVFAGLPGPVQAALAAFVGFRLVSGYLDTASGSASKLAAAVNAVKPDGLRAFNDEARVQRGLAQAAGESIGRWGAYQAAFETSTGRTVTALRDFRDQTNSIRDGAAAAGEPIGRLSAAMGTLSERSGTIGQAAAAFVTVRDRVVDAGTAADGTHGKFTTLAGGLGGVAAAGGSLVKTGLGGLMGALGGPWGLAIGAGVAAISLLADSHARAEEAARRQTQKEQDLATTLDDVTGAATRATREMTAQSLTSTKLSDGTTTLAGALAKAGISATDYVDATTGNQPKLDQLNATLFTQARNALQGSDAWAQNRAELNKAGVTLDLATAAALGNVQAQDEMQRKLDAVGLGWRGLQGKVTDAIGPLGEIGRLLGNQAGTFADAQRGVEQTAAAMQDFDKVLATLVENKGFETLKNGGAITDPMRQGLEALGASATRTAVEAGKVAQKIGDIDGGAAKARESMQASRDSFVKAATAALGSAEAAEALADQIGLIPAAAETIFRLDAQGAQAELITLNEQLKAVPNQKDVTVRTLSAEAQQQLRDMGFAVEQLPDNKGVKVTVEDAEGRARLDAFIATISTAKAAPKIDLDTATAEQKAGAMKSYVEGLVIIAKADADTAPGTAKGDAMKAHIDGITAIMKADADTTPGTVSGDALQAHISGLIGIMTADADNAPGTAKGDAMRGYIEGLIGIMTADANTQPGTAKSDALKAYVDQLRALLKVDADTAAAEAAINYVARNRNTTVSVKWEAAAIPGFNTGGGAAIGGIARAMADGGVLPMASGASLFNGRPMGSTPAGIAQIFPPNTPRIIGDRIRDDEAYIPINGSQRSRAIFEETARRLGYSVARGMADGGVIARADDLQRLIAANRAAFGSGSAGAARVDVAAPVVEVRNYIDGQEIRGVVRTEISASERATIRRAKMGAGV
ncbi:hypothetical protein GCM10023175_52030 [Pseudonocardia xishanensis]|uniref:Phage tail tape measure protein domain-containing protein n=2 Tax=Pseudonocardia xishanensis TaxID=630995 RepID=A0ABP8RZV5_9PSEU